MKYKDLEDNYDIHTVHGFQENTFTKPAKVLPEQKTNHSVEIELEKKVIQQLNLSVLQENLGNCLRIIDDEVMKGYITQLSQLPVVKPDEQMLKNLPDVQLFRISEMVYQENEFSVYKLATVFRAMSNKPCTIVLMINNDGEKNNFYLGVRPLNNCHSSGTMRQMLKQNLLALFPGSKVDEYYIEEMQECLRQIDDDCISSVTCIADYKQSKEALDEEAFIQGLEKFVYSMQGRKCTSIFIADNVSYKDLMMRRREYENIYTQISPFANMQINFTTSQGNSKTSGESTGRTSSVNQGSSRSVSESDSNGISSSFSQNETWGDSDTEGQTASNSNGKTHTKGHVEGTNQSESSAHTQGQFRNMNFGAEVFGGSAGSSSSDTHTVSFGTNQSNSVSDAVTQTLTRGVSNTHSTSSSKGQTFTYGANQTHSSGIQYGKNYNVGEAFNLVNSQTLTDTFGSSQSVTLNAQNMTLSSVLHKLEKQLERIDECESMGMWNFAAYFLGDSASETETAANTYQSIVSGTKSSLECSAVNTWSARNKVSNVSKYVKHFMHPYFRYERLSCDGMQEIFVNPSAMVSSNELAIHMGLPRHSVRGLPVVEHASFAQEVITRKVLGEKKICLGTVYNMGQSTDTTVELDLNSLAMHTFITGSTGSGKSNVVYHLLMEARKKGVHFLVVEPAKGEYKHVFPDVRCFGTNIKLGEILKINPFSFPEGVHVLEHIDRIVEIFNVCWPMYAAMPAVLKESIEQAYISAGWDLDLSENTKVEGLFPTFEDVLRELNTTINNSDYSSDTKGDYIGSLSTRIKSFTNGINGRIFASDEMNLKELFDENAIIDISRVGAMETKALIMGLLVLKLQEYRVANMEGMNVPLKHITVLEEAHNLLKKTSSEQSEEFNNIAGKSVEMISNTIAEIRTYGEGFMIVDQAPNLLDTSVIRNTNTKIVLRLPESVDREVTGGSMALNEAQCRELSKLPTGVAAIYQNDWQEAVLCTLPKYEINTLGICKKEQVHTVQIRKNQTKELLHLLLKKQISDSEYLKLEEQIKISNVSAKIRKDLILNVKKKNKIFEWAVADFIQKNFELYDIFRGTSKCANLDQLGSIMRKNIEKEFNEFDDQELYAIMYYICRIEHEKHPENKAIELLRTHYLREKVM